MGAWRAARIFTYSTMWDLLCGMFDRQDRKFTSGAAAWSRPRAIGKKHRYLVSTAWTSTDTYRCTILSETFLRIVRLCPKRGNLSRRWNRTHRDAAVYNRISNYL